MAGRVEQVHEERERDGCGNRAERGVAPENYHCQPEDDCGGDCLPADRQEYAEAGGDSFAAFEAEPHRKHVADDGADGGDHHPADIALSDVCGEPDGSVTFAGVENQRENSSEFSGVACDVGGADIAAADGPDVWAAERFYDEQAEGNRAEKVRQRRDEPRGADEYRVQFVPSTNGNAAILLYCAPDGFSTLSNKWNSDSRAAPKSYDFRASAARARFSRASPGSRRARVRCGENVRVSRASRARSRVVRAPARRPWRARRDWEWPGRRT